MPVDVGVSGQNPDNNPQTDPPRITRVRVKVKFRVRVMVRIRARLVFRGGSCRERFC